jgi:putative transcriptional regulator
MFFASAFLALLPSLGYTALRYTGFVVGTLRKASANEKGFGKDLVEGMKLVLAHERGTVKLEQVWPKPIDIKAIRKRVKMSQAEFSRAYGIGKRALQEWEQGGRQPDSAARAYLTVIAKEPAVVRRALGKE